MGHILEDKMLYLTTVFILLDVVIQSPLPIVKLLFNTVRLLTFICPCFIRNLASRMLFVKCDLYKTVSNLSSINLKKVNTLAFFFFFICFFCF